MKIVEIAYLCLWYGSVCADKKGTTKKIKYSGTVSKRRNMKINTEKTKVMITEKTMGK